MDPALVQLMLGVALAGCLVNALSALAILLRDPGAKANRVAAALVAGAAWWGACQVMWTDAPDAATAYFWHHLAAPGWAFLGPLALQVLGQHTDPPRWLQNAIVPAYGIGAVFGLLQLTTSWIQGAAYPTPFGWGFVSQIGHAWFLVFTFGCVIPAVWFALRRVRSDPSPALRGQVRLVCIGIAAPFLIAGATGGFLPLFGIDAPRLASASFGVLGATVAFSYYRYGVSALAPGAHAREILATLPNGLALLSLEGKILSGNERMADLIGIDYADLPGTSIESALSVSVLSPIRELREQECSLTTADGDELSVSISTSVLADKRDLALGVVIVVRDLHELVELRNHLVTSGRLAAVGELAAGIAHEINNPIAFVRANLSQLQRDWQMLGAGLPEAARKQGGGVDLIAEGHELIEECIEGVERTVAIVQDVKGFARGGREEHGWIDLNELLSRVLRVARPQIRFDVLVETHFGEIPKVFGAAPELQQVFLNLVLNGTQAIDDGGRVVLSTRNEDGCVVVQVADDGCGIPKEDCERIFDPFFTTKPVGEGTGLGLAISFQILQSHDAQIWVESQLDEGTTFHVRFPALEEGSQAS